MFNVVRLNGPEFEQALRDGEGQGSVMSFGLWGRKESDTHAANSKRSLGLSAFLFLSFFVCSVCNSDFDCSVSQVTYSLFCY